MKTTLLTLAAATLLATGAAQAHPAFHTQAAPAAATQQVHKAAPAAKKVAHETPQAAARRMALQHESLQARRSIAQQAAIASQWEAGAIGEQQFVDLEASQALLDGMRMAMDLTAPTSVDLAMQMQHLQNVQDWAIATGHPVL